jgi:hypothetical protein
MVQETPGAGGANSIHAKIGHDSVADDNDFTVLPANFDDCPDIREVMCGGYGVGGYFVLDDIRADNLSSQITGAASGTYPSYYHIW